MDTFADILKNISEKCDKLYDHITHQDPINRACGVIGVGSGLAIALLGLVCWRQGRKIKKINKQINK